VATAVGRARVPVMRPLGYLLEGLLWCGLCGRPMGRTRHRGGPRAYHCGPGCSRPGTPAVRAEQDLLLSALVRAHAVLYGIGRATATASPVETRRWLSCDLLDRRAVLRTAYLRVVVDLAGSLHPVWRHHGLDLQ